jgi:putative nucleotidyltransferase with HDIG domain
MSITFAAVTMIKHRSKWNRFVFNTSNQLIAGLLYFIIFNLNHMPYLAQPMWKQIFICLAAAGIVFLFTTWTIAIAISLDSNISLKQIWIEKFCWLAPYYLGMGLIAFGLTFAFHYQGIWGVLMIISPLFLLRLSQVQFIDRTRSVVTELKEKNQVLENSSQEIHSLNQALFNTLAEVIDLRDPFVLGHSKKVAYLASAIAKKFKLPEKKIELIYRAGLLHDIGKIGISDSILQKPFPLTNEEIKKIERHPELGANLLKTSQILANLIPIIRHHHERYDGTGYPAGLKGNEIPFEARILTIADAIDAMISNRPYRNGLSNYALLDQIGSGSGSQFDPQVASVTIDLLRSEGEKLIPGFADLNIYDYPSEQLELTFSENSAVLVQNNVLRQ